MRDLARFTRMGAVVAGDDAGGHGHGAQLGRADADDRMVGPFVEALAPSLHDGNEALDIH